MALGLVRGLTFGLYDRADTLDVEVRDRFRGIPDVERCDQPVGAEPGGGRDEGRGGSDTILRRSVKCSHSSRGAVMVSTNMRRCYDRRSIEP